MKVEGLSRSDLGVRGPGFSAFPGQKSADSSKSWALIPFKACGAGILAIRPGPIQPVKKTTLLLATAALLAFATSTGLAQNSVFTGTTNITTSISNFNICIGPTSGSTPIGNVTVSTGGAICLAAWTLPTASSSARRRPLAATL